MTLNYSDRGKQPIVENINKWVLGNENYRTTVWTGVNMQMTLMTISPKDDIGLEVHHGIEQFLKIESGSGVCKIGPTKNEVTFEVPVTSGDSIFVPADMWHNVENTGTEDLKLYTLYAGPDHVEGTVHKTHQDAKDDPNEQD